MNRLKDDKDREHRITYEIVVDCYNEEERATRLALPEPEPRLGS
jgi:hypothetical protein